jgi:broad specificity phosphatase PhoE
MTPSATSPGWPSRLWLVRHAQSVGNVADEAARESGAARLDLAVRDPDVPLTDTGRSQAQALGDWLHSLDQPPDVVLSSPYARATSTAEIALRAGGVALRPHRDERLRERELGQFDGLTAKGIRELLPSESERWAHLGKFYYRPPGGESWADVCLRVRSVVQSLRLEHGGQRVMLLTHQAVVMCFRYVLEDLDERGVLALSREDPLANCGITTYDGSQAGLALRRYNEVAHVVAEDTEVTREPDVSARAI